MINKIDKVFYHKRTECLSVPWNIKYRKIIIDTITLISKNMRFNVEERNYLNTIRFCAFLTDITEEERIVITKDEFDDLDISSDITVSIYPIWEYGVFEVDEITINRFARNFDFYLVGSLNLVDSSVIDNIRAILPWQSMIYYGDPFLDSPEYNNSTAKYLTNAAYELKDNLDTNKKSQNRKVNVTLTKLRADADDILSTISISNSISVLRVNEININDVIDFIDRNKDGVVCVPRRLYSNVINDVWYNKGYDMSLSMNNGSTYYVKYPFIAKTEDGRIVTIKPMDTVRFMNVDDAAFLYNGHECYKCNINAYDKDGNFIAYFKDIIFDRSDYLLSFNNDNFDYDNIDEFEVVNKLLNEESYVNLGNEILCVTPFRIVYPELTKYFSCEKVFAYIEYVERNVTIRSDTNWFKYVCSATEEIDIRYTDEFI